MIFSSKKSEEIICLFDISSGYVDGAIIKITHNEPPTIIFNRKVPISASESKNVSRIRSGMIKALKEATDVIKKEGLTHLKFSKFGHHHLKSAFCVFSSPWYISQTKIIRIDKEKPFAFTSSLMEKLIQDEKKSFSDSINNQEQAKNIKDRVVTLESKVIRVKLNGYETTKPQGKIAKSAELSIYLSASGTDLVNEIKEIIREGLGTKAVHFHTFPLVLFSGVRDIVHPSRQNFLLIDVREEVTDISLIKKELLLETITIPIGSYFFVREVAKSLNTLPQVALSFLRLFSENKAEPQVAEAIKNTLIQKQEWNDHFHTALRKFSEEFFVSKTVYLATDADFMGLFSNMIKYAVYEQFTSDKEPFTVTPVDGILLQGLYKANKSADTSLLPIESIFINKTLIG